MEANPSTVTITADGYSAQIALAGGQLLNLTSTDPTTGEAQDLIVPASQAEGAYAGTVLAPWPNRIAQAKYTYEGTAYELPVNEDSTGAALHGLLHDVTFSVLDQRESEVHLTGELEPSPGYPFRLELVLVYRVASFLGLSTALSVRYVPDRTSEDDGGGAEAGSEPASAPFGVGFHPYLTAAGAPLKACRLRLPARTIAKTKATGKMVGRKPVSGDFDLTDGTLLAGLRIDHAYTDLPAEGWTAELLHGPSGLMVRMISDTAWVQIYTGDQINRAGVAVEPMTCPPNAFNTGHDLIALQPHEWRRFGYSIEAIRL